MDPGWFRFFGWFYFMTCLSSLILHVIVGLAIFHIPTFNQRIALRLLFSMSIADAGQTFLHGVGGFVTMVDWEIPKLPNTIIGLLMETFWEAMMFLQLGLGINRLWIVSRKTITREREFRYFDWPVLLGWIGACIYTVLYWICGRRMHYRVEFLGWPTEFENETSQTPEIVYLINGETTFMSVGFALCILVVIVMAIRRRTKSVSNRMVNWSMELRMLMQISIIYIMSISNIILWNVFATSPVEVQAMLNYEWILICALPPWLNMIVSGEIRRSVVTLIMPTYKRFLNSAPRSISRHLPKPSTNAVPTTHITRINPTITAFKPTLIINSSNVTVLQVASTLNAFTSKNGSSTQRVTQIAPVEKTKSENSNLSVTENVQPKNKANKKKVMFVSPTTSSAPM